METESSEIATLFVNMFISLSYPLNFVIYCCMSRQFRAQFLAMFCRLTVLAGGDVSGGLMTLRRRSRQPD